MVLIVMYAFQRKGRSTAGDRKRAKILGMGVGIFVDFFEAVNRDVGVNLGGGEGFVAEEFLYDAEVCSRVEHVGGEGVSQGVGGDFVTTGEDLLHVFIYAALDGAGGDGTATEIYKHLVVFSVGNGRADV